MLEPRFTCLVLAHCVLGACTTATLPVLPAAPPAQKEDASRSGDVPVEVATVVATSPTETYSLVARGALRCWFGADGPLKPRYVFHAEAESPAAGGSAEIVLHERDEELRDKRGARALRIAFTTEAGGARVAVSFHKLDSALAEVMARDVAGWAKGGGECGLREVTPLAVLPVAGQPTPGGSNRR